jgi:hypothetical protein
MPSFALVPALILVAYPPDSPSDNPPPRLHAGSGLRFERVRPLHGPT